MWRILGALALLGLGAGGQAQAQAIGASGEEVYRSICQGCHMADGSGAVGAGRYPALASNQTLSVAAYPVTLVLQGQRAMPGFGAVLSDEQIANVVTYIRTQFGNSYNEAVTVEFVRQAR